MFKLAELFVSVVAETSSLDRALQRTHGNLSMANIALGTFAGNVAASFARMAVGAAGGLFEATIRSASHLGETMNRVKVTLGDSSDKVIKDADVMADKYGFVKNEVLGAASSFSLLGKEMKMTDAGSADLGIKLTRMASELTSFFDPSGGLPAMMHKLESGIAGQVKPLRELGIFMTADAVKQEAARMGLKPGASGELSEGDKIKARISFIENSKAMQLATGDLERTLGETENQTRKFWGALSNLGTSIGQELNPAWNKLIQSFNSGLGDIKKYFEENKSTIRAWGDSVVETFETAKIAWRNWPDIVEIAMTTADQKMENSRAGFDQWATTVAVYIENAFLKAAQSVGNFFNTLQGYATTAVSYLVMPAQYLAEAFKVAFDFIDQTWDYAVEALARKADFVFRPIRDLANFIERKTGMGNYKQMSVEEDIGRAKGALGGLSEVGKVTTDYFKGLQDNLAMMAKGKPADFTSGLMAKANKHLADTLTENTDISSRKRAEIEERMRKRESDRLQAIADVAKPPKALTDDIFGPNKETAKKKKLTDDIFGPNKEEAAEAALGATKKHHRALEDSATFTQNLAAQQLGGDVQDKQLTELQKIREIDQKNADAMDRMYNKAARAVYA